MVAVKIVRAKASDLKDFSKLRKIFEKEYSKKYHNEQFHFLSDNGIKREFKESMKNYFLIAKQGNNSVGYFIALFLKNYKKGYISDIFILKELRNQSLATKMKDLFLKELKKKKYREVTLDININNPAIKTYENWGLKIVKYRMLKKLK